MTMFICPCKPTAALALLVGSHVLVAMGHGGANDVLRGTMRLSVGRLTTEDEARRGVQVLVDQLASSS